MSNASSMRSTGNNPDADGTYGALREGRGSPEYERQDATELAEYALHFNETDELTPSQRGWAERQFHQFKAWYGEWSALPGAVQACKP